MFLILITTIAFIYFILFKHFNVFNIDFFSNTNNDKITVVLLNYERNDNVRKIIDSLNKIDEIDEIIILHGKSENYYKFENAKNIKDYENNKKYKAGRRFLIDQKEIKNKYIMFLDDDLVPSSDLVKNMYKIIKKNSLQLCGPYKRICNKTVGYDPDLYKENYDIILTGLCITSKDVLSNFNKNFDKYAEILEKTGGNGEDIFFNKEFIETYNKKPIYVKGNFKQLPAPNAYSSKPDHYDIRNNICKEIFNDKQNSYTIGVPCIPEDIEKLENLVKNINKQTKQPLEIIISLSETNINKGRQIETKLNKHSNVPIKIITSENKKFAGENRNTVIENTNGNIIAFVDADDTMHPKRIEIIDKIFKDEKIKGNDPIGILHGYHIKETGFDTNYKIWDGKKLYNYHKNHPPTKERTHLLNDTWEENIQHGHIVIKKNIPLRYTNMRRGQDVEFVRNVLNYYGPTNNNLCYTTAKLTIYSPRK